MLFFKYSEAANGLLGGSYFFISFLLNDLTEDANFCLVIAFFFLIFSSISIYIVITGLTGLNCYLADLDLDLDPANDWRYDRPLLWLNS